ncbi:unnamed protein product [Dovyalis caffra]|uniref:Protein kinase domain-containing protein n=1 Tax=Dovyalis caffra TaxID=77055 RepID=A0AAV1S4H9_9ROSI|nr:unnamed protein product [Dovyalis caffra]
MSDMLLELARREKIAGIKPDEDLDIFIKGSRHYRFTMIGKGISDHYFADSKMAKASLQANDVELAKELWDFSLDLVRRGSILHKDHKTDWKKKKDQHDANQVGVGLTPAYGRAYGTTPPLLVDDYRDMLLIGTAMFIFSVGFCHFCKIKEFKRSSIVITRFKLELVETALRSVLLDEYPRVMDTWMHVISSQGSSLFSVDLLEFDVIVIGLCLLKDYSNIQLL